MAGGKYSALQRLQPLQGDISTEILNREDQQFKHRAEQREIADRKAKAKAIKNKQAEDAIKKATSLKLYSTKSTSLDEVVVRAIKLGVEKQTELTKLLANKDKYSEDDVIKAELALQQLNNLPENLKLMTDFQTNEYTDYKKRVDEGSIFKDEEYESRFKDGYAGMSIVIGDDGTPMNIFRKGKSDINGDGKIDDFDIETLQTIGDAQERPQFQDKYDYNKIIALHADKLESVVNKTVNPDGFGTTKITGVEIDKLNATVNRALFRDGEPTNLMKSFVKENGLDINNSADLDKIEAQYKNDVLIRTKRGIEVDPNSSAKISAARLALEKKKFTKENNEETGLGITLNVDENGKPVTTAVKGGEGSNKSKYSFVVDPTKQKEILIGNDKITIQEYFLEDSGEISYKGTLNTIEPGTIKDEEGKIKGNPNAGKPIKKQINGGGLNKTQLGLVARANGFEYADDFKKHLEEKRDAKIKPQAKKEISASLISEKASAAGYTVEEYKKLLEKNGVKIID